MENNTKIQKLQIQLGENKLKIQYYAIRNEELLKELSNCLEEEIKEFFTKDIHNLPKQYQTLTSEGVKVKYVTADDIKNSAKNIKTEKRILVIDMKYLPHDAKETDESSDELIEYLEEQYGVKVFLIDSSRANLQGTSQNPPIYFI